MSAILLDYTFPTSSPFIDSAINERRRQRAHRSSTTGWYNTHLKPKKCGNFLVYCSAYFVAFCGLLSRRPYVTWVKSGDIVAPIATFWRETFWLYTQTYYNLKHLKKRISSHWTQSTTSQISQLPNRNHPLRSQSRHNLWPNIITIQMIKSYYSHSLYVYFAVCPSVSWLQNCQYYCHMYRSLQTWPLQLTILESTKFSDKSTSTNTKLLLALLSNLLGFHTSLLFSSLCIG